MAEPKPISGEKAAEARVAIKQAQDALAAALVALRETRGIRDDGG